MYPARFGVFLLPNTMQEAIDGAKRAEADGFYSASVNDHFYSPLGNPQTPQMECFTTLTAMACHTSKIKLAPAVAAASFRTPPLLAKIATSLDHASNGRLILGLGAGWLQGEYEAIGIPFDRAGVRIDRFEEVIALLRASFADGELNIDTPHVHAVGFEAVPKPFTKSGPPIMIGGGAKRILTIAGREADIVSLNFNNSSGQLGAAGIGSSTAELTDQKIQWIKDGAGARFDQIEMEIAAYFTIVTPDGEGTRAKMAPMFGMTPEVFAEHPNALIGSVDEICDRIVERRERFGISYVSFGASVIDAVIPVVERLTGK
jgi:probable F420-dependent oxidoreductase